MDIKKVSVQIVDDHKMLVEGLERIFFNSGRIEVTGKAHTLQECRQMLRRNRADVLLLDVHLPDGNGVAFCREILDKYPELKIMALTSFSEYSVVSRMLDNGALGYVLKNAMAEEMIMGVLTVATGARFLCAEVDMLLKKKPNQEMMLTGKEREMLRLITEGYTNPEIADKIALSVETINTYRKNLLLKLQARNTAVLVKVALEQKLI